MRRRNATYPLRRSARTGRPVAVPDINATIHAVWRMESAKLIAGLTREVRDVGLAEELAQDALVAALERWPHDRRPPTSRRRG